MFVLLEHNARDGVHWDFIVELPGREQLPTWRLLENPLTHAGEIAAQPIAAHRRLFLDYEGPLREGRGTVRRLDRGAADVERCDSRRLVMRLSGTHLHGRFEIRGGGDEASSFRRLDDATPAGSPPSS
jgi:hypothetical protein